jgi:enoyl-CoA hydratase/carnithine racemase
MTGGTSEATLEIERRGGTAIMRMKRGAVNALDLAAVEAMRAAIDALAADETLAALVLTGAGPAFCAGLDLKAVPTYGREQQRALADGLNRLFGGLYGFPRPTVAAVNGHAIAGGMVLLLACDHRVCTRDAALLGLTEVKVGVPFPVAAIEVARTELSPAAARALVLFGRLVGPEQALAWGAVDELAAPEAVLERACAEAAALAELPRETFASVKRTLRQAPLERIRAAIEDGADPTLDDWLSAETVEAAKKMLAGRAA